MAQKKTTRKKMNLKLDKGALHRRMKIPTKKTIATGKIKADLAKARKAKNTKHTRQDVFALNARKWKKR